MKVGLVVGRMQPITKGHQRMFDTCFSMGCEKVVCVLGNCDEISKDNPFKYVGIDEILEIFESGTGVVFFGNSDDEFSRETVRLFTEAIEDSEVKNIDVYYYDPVVIRDNKDYKYNELLALLEGYLNKNNDEDYLYLPDIYFVKEGKIIGHDNESAFVATSNEEYSIDEIKNKLFNKYVKLLNDYNREDTDE